MIKLHAEEKFFLEDDSDLILVDAVEVDQNMVKNNFLFLHGTMFFVDYEKNNIDKANCRVAVMISFNIEDIGEVD